MSRATFRTLTAALALGPFLTAIPLRADFSAEQLARLDRPFQGEQIALAPDGKHVAYSMSAPGRLTLRIVDLEAKKIVDLPVVTTSPTPRLLHLRWASTDRLLFEDGEGNAIAVNADGGHSLKFWDGHDDGIQNKLYMALQSRGRAWRDFLGALPPRLLPPAPDDPGHVLLESRGLYGFTFRTEVSNLYRINIHTADLELVGDTRGNLPMAQYSNGRMLYDRQGSPRLLRDFGVSARNDQPLYYTAPGQSTRIIRGVPRTTFDEFLGRPHRPEFTLTADNYFGGHSVALNFDYNPDVLYYASNVGRDTYGVFALNLVTKVRTELATAPHVDLTGPELDNPEHTLVFDDSRRRLVGVRFKGLRSQTAWLDQELAQIQSGLERNHARETVEILQWDDSRRRVLARVSSGSDPGRYLLLDRQTGLFDVLLERAPWLNGDDVNPAIEFAFDTPAGVHLTGYLTLPRKPRSEPPPLIVEAEGGLWGRSEPGFNREAQALANLGFVVLRVNYRGIAGFGRRHLAGVLEGIDTVPLDDIQATLAWLAGRYQFDRKRVTVMGEGFGGYLALRAVQLRPEEFHAAISINSPTNLRAWAKARPDARSGAGGLQDFRSVVRENFLEPAFSRPPASPVAAPGDRSILVIEGDSENLTPWSTLFGQLGLGMKGTRVERLAIKGDLENGTPETRAKVFQRIDEFLNVELYEGISTIGPLKVLPDPPAGAAPDR